MSDELTDRQQAILDYLAEAIRERGFPPSIREISAHFKITSTQGVQRHLDALERKGYLERDSRARSIRLTNPGRAGSSPVPLDIVRMVPLLGQVAAGQPIAALENVEEQVPIATDWLAMSQDYFLLRVRGLSMADAIQPGDMVLVERQPRAERGEIVVAQIEDEATVKRYYPEPGRVILRSDNPDYDDIIVTHDLTILGKVTALIRKYR